LKGSNHKLQEEEEDVFRLSETASTSESFLLRHSFTRLPVIYGGFGGGKREERVIDRYFGAHKDGDTQFK